MFFGSLRSFLQLLFCGAALLLILIAGVFFVAFVFPFLDDGRFFVIRNWAKSLLVCCRVQVIVDVDSSFLKESKTDSIPYLLLPKGALFLANHLSWIDIPLLQSIFSPGFVAKSEIRKWPIVGWLTWKTGCVFIDRKKMRSMLNLGADLERLLNAGSRIVLFPEGTRRGQGDGSLRPFRSGLIESAVRLGVPVVPVAISYKTRTGMPLPSLEKPSFLSSLKKTLLAEPIVAYVKCLPTINASDRRSVAKTAQELIANALQEDFIEGKPQL